MEICLNLGCGNKKLENYLGMDKYFCKGADFLGDVSNIPVKTSSVSKIMLDNVIEHILDIPALMKEIYRISKNNALITIRTPHFTSLSSWIDPTHFHHLSYFSMEHFIKDNVAHYTGKGFKLIKRNLSFGGIWSLIGKLIFLISPKEYEKRWCFIFRAGTLTFQLQVIK